MKVFVNDLILIPTLCSWSRKLRSLEDSMAIYLSQTASQVSLFIGFLISWISLPTKTTKIGTPRIKVISKVFVNDLILIPCVKTTEIHICEQILTTSGYRNKINFKTIH
jgi:hypothetical protein